MREAYHSHGANCQKFDSQKEASNDCIETNRQNGDERGYNHNYQPDQVGVVDCGKENRHVLTRSQSNRAGNKDSQCQEIYEGQEPDGPPQYSCHDRVLPAYDGEGGAEFGIAHRHAKPNDSSYDKC